MILYLFCLTCLLDSCKSFQAVLLIPQLMNLSSYIGWCCTCTWSCIWHIWAWPGPDTWTGAGSGSLLPAGSEPGTVNGAVDILRCTSYGWCVIVCLLVLYIGQRIWSCWWVVARCGRVRAWWGRVPYCWGWVCACLGLVRACWWRVCACWSLVCACFGLVCACRGRLLACWGWFLS